MLTLTSPVETPLHRIPAGIKLAAVCIFTIALFQLEDLRLIAGVTAAVLAVYPLFGRRFARAGLKLLKPLLPFIVIVAAWHWWLAELAAGTAIILRMIAAVALANLVTMTTRLSDIIDTLSRLIPRRGLFGLTPRIFGLSVALMIRFIPTAAEKAERIGLAWKARSARRPGFRVITPVTLSVLDDAAQVSDALKARGGIE